MEVLVFVLSMLLGASGVLAYVFWGHSISVGLRGIRVHLGTIHLGRAVQKVHRLTGRTSYPDPDGPIGKFVLVSFNQQDWFESVDGTYRQADPEFVKHILQLWEIEQVLDGMKTSRPRKQSE